MEESQRRYIEIEQPDGKVVKAKVILNIHLDSTDKDYIVYSFDEIVDNDKTILYTAEIEEHEDSYSIETIEDPNVWDEIKEIMQKIIRENS